MKILVTGAAGFVGSHLCKLLARKKFKVAGIDCISDYYDKKFKLDRLKWIGKKNFKFYQINLLNKKNLSLFFSENHFNLIIHLAAQPGVIYSLKNPYSYIENNIMAYLNLLEFAKKKEIKNIIYASSSSVYGKSNKLPFNESQIINKPLTIYAATKITDEHISYSYSNLYSMNFVGLRFFTVYGPWGRPDMSPYIFVKSILNGTTINLFDKGNGIRDFTYIDDVINGILKIVQKFKKENKLPKYQIYNIGNSEPTKINKVLTLMEKIIGKKAKISLKPRRKADMQSTFSDSSKFENHYKFKTKFSLENGLKLFIKWFRNYHKKK